ncbi:MAG: response regulator, partial [Treponema sp.]|nr:response regulator [Treponema sp.]
HSRGGKLQKIIFVVDDNDMNLIVAKETLKNLYRVITMLSGTKMFSLLEKIKPDLILLDVYMEDMDGFEALEKLKKNSSFADIPVILLTGTYDAEVEARGYQMGVKDFMTKPYSGRELINKINTHLNTGGAPYQDGKYPAAADLKP